MLKSPAASEFTKVLSQVPADYYHSGVKNNLFQKIWHTKKWRDLEIFLDGARGRLLDIGCADGTTTGQIKQKFPHLEVYGVDLYSKAIKFAQKKSKDVFFLQADAHKLPFPKNHFDIVTTIEVLEHMQNGEQVLGEIYRVLKPGGTLIVVQDTDSPLFKVIWWLWTRSKGSVWENSHINCMTPDKLLKLLRAQGFLVKQKRLTNLGMEVFIKLKKQGDKNK